MAANAQAQLRQGKRNRLLRENLTAYAFLFPAALIIFVFGLFPVLFAFFVSLHRWRRFPDEYIGLGNYEEALGGAVYVVFFWLALAALGLGLVWLWRVIRAAYEQKQFSRLIYTAPALLNALTALLFARWFALLLPVVLNIPQRLRGQAQVQGIFVNELFLSFQMPEVAEAGNLFLVALIAALVISMVVSRSIAVEERGALLLRMTGAFLAFGIGFLILQLTVEAIGSAIETARADGTDLPIWSQIILISLGIALLGAAYWLWTRSVKQHDDRRFLLLALGGILLAAGGYLLIGDCRACFPAPTATCSAVLASPSCTR